MVEANSEFTVKSVLVIGLKFRLRRWKRGPDWIIHKMQGHGTSIAKGVEQLKAADAFFKHTVATLLGDIFRFVTRQGCDDRDMMLQYELSELQVRA